MVSHVRPAAFNDYYYSLTEAGQRRAQNHMNTCSYVGPAPVPLADYVLSVEAQAAGLDPIDRDQLRAALSAISYQDELLDQIGPAVNSNTGMFLFGPPGKREDNDRSLPDAVPRSRDLDSTRHPGRRQPDQTSGRRLPPSSTGS